MTRVEAYRRDAEYAFRELLKAVEGLTERHSWAMLPPGADDYLHTDGSIHGVVLHLASVKWAYGSICFRNSEIRWRDIADHIEAFEPSWQGALDYLKEGQEYWMLGWATLTEGHLDNIVPTNYKEDLPAWRMIQIMNHHDAYHAGQIAVIRYATVETDTHPMSQAEDIRQHCRESKHW